LEIEGHPTFKDAKLFPGGARAWDWRETGTGHVPGIQNEQQVIRHPLWLVIVRRVNLHPALIV
jgi:hypothetical protein